jgi:hypothetical protein
LLRFSSAKNFERFIVSGPRLFGQAPLPIYITSSII